MLLVAILFTLFLSFDLASFVQASEQKEWTWKDSKGNARTKAELLTLLQKHKEWLNTTTFYDRCTDKEGFLLWSRSPLGSELAGAEIFGDVGSFSPLSGSDLRCANLSEANLSGTAVDGARMRGAYLSHAKLRKTMFHNSDLQGITFDQADMEGAVLSGVVTGLNLSDASFGSANLAGATLIEVDLANAQFAGTDLLNVKFEPKTLPLLRSIASASNLETMRYIRNPEALTLLRAGFKNAGFREQERKTTYALKRRETELLYESCAISLSGVLPCIYGALNTVLFDWTVQYGMSPGRMFVVVGCLLFLFTVLYDLFAHFSETSGLLVVVPAGREKNRPSWLRAYLLKPPPYNFGGSALWHEYRIHSRSIEASTYISKIWGLLKREWVLLWVAFVFSMMSTFNIKFRDVDFGRWIRLLTTNDYDIKATGWARTLSGVQALACVYLVALGIASYFLRPFE